MVNLRTPNPRHISLRTNQQDGEGTHLGYTLDLWWLMGIVRVDSERELERRALVHAYNPNTVQKTRAWEVERKRLTLVRRNHKLKVKQVLGVREVGHHSRR